MTAIATETQRKKNGPAPMFGRRRFFAVRLEGDDAMHLTRQSQREGSAQAYLLRLVQEDKARQQGQSQSPSQPQHSEVA